MTRMPPELSVQARSRVRGPSCSTSPTCTTLVSLQVQGCENFEAERRRALHWCHLARCLPPEQIARASSRTRRPLCSTSQTCTKLVSLQVQGGRDSDAAHLRHALHWRHWHAACLPNRVHRQIQGCEVFDVASRRQHIVNLHDWCRWSCLARLPPVPSVQATSRMRRPLCSTSHGLLTCRGVQGMRPDR